MARLFESLRYTRREWASSGLGSSRWPLPVTPFRARHRSLDNPYVVRGILHGPADRTAPVATVWMVWFGEDVPCVVTAYLSEIR